MSSDTHQVLREKAMKEQFEKQERLAMLRFIESNQKARDIISEFRAHSQDGKCKESLVHNEFSTDDASKIDRVSFLKQELDEKRQAEMLNLETLDNDCARTAAVVGCGESREALLTAGRQQFLKQRNTLSPKHKHAFPILSSWQYGWTNSCQNREIIPPKRFGRVCRIQREFYKNSGIL